METSHAEWDGETAALARELTARLTNILAGPANDLVSRARSENIIGERHLLILNGLAVIGRSPCLAPIPSRVKGYSCSLTTNDLCKNAPAAFLSMPHARSAIPDYRRHCG
jgi:hypothetical protein